MKNYLIDYLVLKSGSSPLWAMHWKKDFSKEWKIVKLLIISGEERLITLVSDVLKNALLINQNTNK